MISLPILLAQNAFGNMGISPPMNNAYTENVTTGNSGEGILNTLALVVSNIIGFLTTLGALFFIVYFFMGGFSWITAGGESGKIEKARNQMVQGVLGLVVMIISYSLLGIIGKVIGIDFLNIADTLGKIIP